MNRTSKSLPDAPQWFWDCKTCQAIAPLICGHWKEWATKKNADGTLWSHCEPFFLHYHNVINHDDDDVVYQLPLAIERCGSQVELARKLGVHVSSVWNWKKGAVYPTSEQMKRIRSLAA